MKKEYTKPQAKVVKIRQMRLLAGSNPPQLYGGELEVYPNQQLTEESEVWWNENKNHGGILLPVNSDFSAGKLRGYRH